MNADSENKSPEKNLYNKEYIEKEIYNKKDKNSKNFIKIEQAKKTKSPDEKFFYLNDNEILQQKFIFINEEENNNLSNKFSNEKQEKFTKKKLNSENNNFDKDKDLDLNEFLYEKDYLDNEENLKENNSPFIEKEKYERNFEDKKLFQKENLSDEK